MSGRDVLASRPPWLVLLALAVVPALDLVQFGRPWPWPVVGALDEPAHLATAWLLLAALAGRASAGLWAWALAGSVLIDLDHVPLYLGWTAIAPSDGRPVTHSLALAGALALLGTVRRLRTPALGLSLGVLAHLVRDLATGPGVLLAWPFSDADVTVPRALYTGLLVVLALLALAGRSRRQVTGRAAGSGSDAGSAHSRTGRSRYRGGSAHGPAGHDHRNSSSRP